MNKLMMPLAALVAASLAGCTTVEYECPLKETRAGGCASMQDAYVASNRAGGKQMGKNEQSVFERASGEAGSEMQERPYFRGEESNFPQPGERGMPVFKQPEVHRVWVAPYVDGDGNLRSGEYTYFSTPGKWNYGSTKRAGQASGIFGPQKPDNLGFQPVTEEDSDDKPASPPSTGGNKSGVPADAGNITQPAQRITQ